DRRTGVGWSTLPQTPALAGTAILTRETQRSCCAALEWSSEMTTFCRWVSVIVVAAAGAFAAEYSPAGVLGDTSDQHRFRVEWYSKHLAAMGEPSLLELSRADAYRFLWLRSFHHPISARLVVRNDGTATLISKETG